MICPTCSGEREIPALFPLYRDGHTALTAMVPCSDCDATGQVSDLYPFWKAIGKQCWARRIAMGRTLRELCSSNGLDAVAVSKMERGFASPAPYMDVLESLESGAS